MGLPEELLKLGVSSIEISAKIYFGNAHSITIHGLEVNPMPENIKYILDNNVEDFKNGYKEARDWFEANVDDIPSDVRTNSRKLREFWSKYWKYTPN